MNALLSEILDAHGGEDLWRSDECVDADILTSGGFFALKGMTADAATRRATVWMHERRASLPLYGGAEQCTPRLSTRPGPQTRA